MRAQRNCACRPWPLPTATRWPASSARTWRPRSTACSSWWGRAACSRWASMANPRTWNWCSWPNPWMATRGSAGCSRLASAARVGRSTSMPTRTPWRPASRRANPRAIPPRATCGSMISWMPACSRSAAASPARAARACQAQTGRLRPSHCPACRRSSCRRRATAPCMRASWNRCGGSGRCSTTTGFPWDSCAAPAPTTRCASCSWNGWPRRRAFRCWQATTRAATCARASPCRTC